MSPYQVAIIGTGNAVNNMIEAMNDVGERARLVAAVDLDAERVKTAAEKYNIPKWYTESEAMLAEIQPDLVLIVTPPATHLSLSLACLEAGAWVYCEKPLCASLAEFDRIIAAEKATERYVSNVFQWRFGSAARHVKKLMESGELGQPMLGHCHTLWYRTQAYYENPWRGKWATEIGGPTMTLGIHLMDLFLWLMGDWHEVQGLIDTLDHDIEVEDVSMAFVRFANGAIGNITNSTLSPRQESTLRLDFQRATIELSALYRYTNANWRFSIPANSTHHEDLARWQTIEQDIKGTHGVQLNELLDSMDAGERPFVSGEESRRILEFTTCLYKSSFTGQPVQRGSITPNDPFYHAMNGQPQETT
jgi:predicted dehydrogenase